MSVLELVNRRCCSHRLEVKMILEVVKVKGDEAHDFYLWAKSQVGFAGRPRWNFHKFLVSRDGQITDWFSSVTPPDSDKMKQAIEQLLS